MKLKVLIAAGIGLFLSYAVVAKTALTTEEDKISYAIGADLGKNFKKQDIKVNVNVLSEGVKDAQSGRKLQMNEEALKQALMALQKKIITKRMAELNAAAEKNKKAGSAFLAANKKKKGIITLDSGLQYKVIKPGTGKKPTKDDMVTVEYTGKLLNGKVFDSSKRTGKPATFKVTQVIRGWTEALQLMKKGATWEIYVPSKLAYGPRGIGGPIGPNETLIFTIHLVSIQKSSA